MCQRSIREGHEIPVFRVTHLEPPTSSDASSLVHGALGGRVRRTILLAAAAPSPWASASPTGVGLGDATAFAVLAGSAVTNTGASSSPGPGCEPWHVGDRHTRGGRRLDLRRRRRRHSTGRPGYRVYKCGETDADLPDRLYDDGPRRQELGTRVYNASSSMQLTGTLTLNGNGDPNAVFVFQAGSSLITASDSTVNLIGMRRRATSSGRSEPRPPSVRQAASSAPSWR